MVFIILTILGLCIGSFINAWVWRTHYNAKNKKVGHSLSIVNGRSICPSCSHQLAWLDLIPLFSYLMLRGKCRYCHAAIGIQEPLFELLTAILFVFSYEYWPYQFQHEGVLLFIFWLVIIAVLLALFIYDIRWQILPNQFVAILTVLVVIQLVVRISYDPSSTLDILLVAFWGVLFSTGIFYALYSLSGGKWIGGGDVKMSVALGILLGGPANVLLMIFLASLLGSLLSLPLIALKKLKTSSVVAFGPLLVASTIVCFFFGSQLINFYERIFF